MERNNTQRWIRIGVRMGLTALCAAAITGCGTGTFGNGEGTDLNGVNDGNGDDGDGYIDGMTHATLRGYVKTPSDLPLAGVEVIADGGFHAVTDADGRYELPEVAVDERIVMTFIKDGWATSSSSLVVTAAGQNYHAMTLAPVDLSTDFDSVDGLDFIIDDTHGFAIPGETIQRLDGTAFDGLVHINATVWDRETPVDEGGEFLASPGDGRGTDELGDDHLLYTFGMFQLELSAVDTGERLQAGPGVRVNVIVPEDSNLQDGEQVEYWDFDPTQSTWSEQDSGTIMSLPGGDQVWEFEPTQGLPARATTLMLAGNPDKPIIIVTSSTAKGRFCEPDGTPIEGAPVRVIAADQTFMASTQTNANGEWSMSVPPVVSTPIGPNGRPMFLEFDYIVADKPSLWRANPVSPVGNGGTLDFGTMEAGSMTCLDGTVVDPQGNPVSGINVSNPHGGNAISGNDGTFELNVPKWQPSTLYAGNATSNFGFQPVKVRPVPQSSSDCPNQVVIQAYPLTTCAAGTVSVDGWAADGVRVEAFDDRFPGAPIFSTTTESGDYCVTIPANLDVTVRVGAGDLVGDNACGQYSMNASVGVESCEDGICESLPSFECGG